MFPSKRGLPAAKELNFNGINGKAALGSSLFDCPLIKRGKRGTLDSQLPKGSKGN
jgi:hypothetical protein